MGGGGGRRLKPALPPAPRNPRVLSPACESVMTLVSPVPMLTPELNVALTARQVGRIAAGCSQAKWSSRARTRSFHVTFTQHSLAEDSGSAPVCSGAVFTGGGPCDLHLNAQPVYVSLREAEAEGSCRLPRSHSPELRYHSYLLRAWAPSFCSQGKP